MHVKFEIELKLEVLFQKRLQGFHQISKREKHLKP